MNDIKASHSAQTTLIQSHQHVKRESEPAAPRGVEGEDDGGGWSEERTAEPLIYPNTSVRLHL